MRSCTLPQNALFNLFNKFVSIIHPGMRVLLRSVILRSNDVSHEVYCTDLGNVRKHVLYPLILAIEGFMFLLPQQCYLFRNILRVSNHLRMTLVRLGAFAFDLKSFQVSFKFHPQNGIGGQATICPFPRYECSKNFLQRIHLMGSIVYAPTMSKSVY